MPNLSWTEVRDRAIAFSRDSAKSASEHAEKQTFWNDFFAVFGRERRTVASFEVAVKNIHGAYNYIDLLWRGVLLVEHKSRGKSLAAAESQAFAYIEDLSREGRFDEIPRYVIVSDFARIALYDLEPDEQADLPRFAERQYTVTDFSLSELHRYVRRFAFLKGERTVRIREEDPANQKAYDRMCELHDELEANGFKGEPLERCLVRLLFCLFADDTGVFEPDTFETFIQTRTREDGSDLGLWLNKLFAVLNTRETDWSPADRDVFAGFRYINGDLFKDTLPFPDFNRSTRKALLEASAFQWARVSPAVFGSLFQGIMEKGERRQRGAHYTSERDILKVVHPLFVDFLEAELIGLSGDKSTRRATRLKDYLQKLRNLRFLDPACGCGNFLVIAYRELRRLELRALNELHADGEQAEALGLLVRVNVDQFYGIEIDRWPAEIARAAMWLMDHQMNQAVTEAFARDFARLPLQTSPHIITGNALRLDWKTVLSPAMCSYVLGNPPFVGKALRNAEQKHDMDEVWSGVKGAGILDYVTCWYHKAAEYIAGTNIPVAFVSTNSISQGEQVGILWGELYRRWNLKILFAHRPFAWASEARGSAHVHVVIIGFGADRPGKRRLFDLDPIDEQLTHQDVDKISPYLVANSEAIVRKATGPIFSQREIAFGNMPNDGGHLLLSPSEREQLRSECPDADAFLRPFLGSDEFINGIERWCLWITEDQLSKVRSLPPIMRRIEAVRQVREQSPRLTTQELALTPWRFGELRQPKSRYLAVPKTSSERRRYIPIGFLDPEVIASTELQTIDGADLWDFGILTSAMHMAWVGTVCGRLESRFRYSNTLVYNNYPWPEMIDAKRRSAVEAAAQEVLDARKPFLPPVGNSTLADLYDPLTMPTTLAKAHAELDRAVDRCYRDTIFKSHRERLEYLFSLYDKFTTPLLPSAEKKKGRKAKVFAMPTEALSPIDSTNEEMDDPEMPEADKQSEEVPWYQDALRKMQEGFGDDGTDRLADMLENLISSGRFVECDTDLGVIADQESQYPPDALITLLTFSRSAKAHLPNRARIREAACRRLLALGKNADEILRRL